MDYPSTRKEAKATGAKYYFTGKPCKRGHVATRKTKGCCTECMKEDWTTDNERRKGLPKSEASKAAGRKYYERNKALVKAKATGQDRDKVNTYKRKWKHNNKEHVRIYTNTRRRRFRQATPAWLTKEQKLEIRAEYEKAKEWTNLTGSRFVVDHIVPLQGEKVCGLHVPWNLEVIHTHDNAKKSNKLDL